MAALQFPCTIFTTQKQMDDYGTSDMCCPYRYVVITGARNESQ